MLLMLKEQKHTLSLQTLETKIHPFVVLGVGSYASLTNCTMNETMLNAYSLCRKCRCHDRIGRWSCRDGFALMNSTNRTNAEQVMRTDAGLRWVCLDWSAIRFKAPLLSRQPLIWKHTIMLKLATATSPGEATTAKLLCLFAIAFPV